MSGSMNENPVLSGRRMQLADYAFQRWGANVPTGTTLDEVLHPSFFRNFAQQLKPGSMILVLSEDFTLDVELRVLTTTNATVKTRVLRDSCMKSPAVQAPKDAASGASVEWGGPQHKWRITRDGVVEDKGFATKEDAQAAADGLAKMKKPEAA